MALEGPGPTQMLRRGLDLKLIKAGDELGAWRYLRGAMSYHQNGAGHREICAEASGSSADDATS